MAVSHLPDATAGVRGRGSSRASARLRRGTRDATGPIAKFNPRGEVVSIPWPSGYPLEAYFLPASATAVPASAVICMGEPGQRKEEYLYKVARHAGERGMALLAVDLLGARP